MSQPPLTTHFPDVREAFVEAARNGKRCMSIDGGRAQPPVKCSGCNKDLEPPRAFAAAVSLEDADAEDDEHKFCVDCRGALLGPPCAGCAKPVRRADGLIALERHWHRSCLRCAHGSCGALLGERHFAHEGLPYCRTHYLELAGEHCAKCGLVVDGGLRALGRVWHDECLRCAETDAPLAPGTAYLHEGRPVAPAARLQTAPRCHACNEPCISNRVYAHGCVYHNDCFRCVHSREVIGDRKFVVFDGEPYLEGHYQKLFGTSAGEAMRTQVHGTHNRYAVCVPLLLSLGNSGLKAFIERHEELMPQVCEGHSHSPLSVTHTHTHPFSHA
jgi:hypothetical protein